MDFLEENSYKPRRLKNQRIVVVTARKHGIGHPSARDAPLPDVPVLPRVGLALLQSDTLGVLPGGVSGGNRPSGGSTTIDVRFVRAPLSIQNEL